MTKYWIWLSTRKYVTPRTLMKVLQHFSSPEAVYAADAAALQLVEGLTQREQQELQNRDMQAVEKILSDCYERNISILTWQDAQYPERLRNIPDPPVVLYYRGRLPDFDTEPAVAVVGTRSATPYGILMGRRLGYQMGRCGALVISGFARGADSAAIEGALTAGRPVVGVLGCGVDVVYPRENRRLFQDVETRGCLISEYPPGTKPLGANFPARNRIMSGLAVGVVVVEAPEGSGALITARHALEQGRDVYALPGNVNSEMSVGCNQLLRDGATPISNGWEVMEEYQALYPQKIQYFPDSAELLSVRPEDLDKPPQRSRRVASAVKAPKPQPEEKTKKAVDNEGNGAYIDLQELKNTRSKDQMEILLALRDGPVHADDIVERTRLTASCVNAALSLLEVDGLVEKLPGRRYQLLVKLKESEPFPVSGRED